MGSLTGIHQSSSQGRVTHRDSQGQLASWIRALALAEVGQFPQRGRTPEFASQLDAEGRQGIKKRRAEERRPSRIATGANQIRPES